MNILETTDVFFPRINGVSTSIATLNGELERRGHRVVLIAPDYGDSIASCNGIVRVAARKVPFDPEDRWMRPRARFIANALAGRGSFDLVHVHTPFVAHRLGVRLGQRLGIPVVETYHTHFEEYLHQYVPILPSPILRAVARRISVSRSREVQRIVVPSQAMEDVLRGYGVRKRIEIVPTGLRLDELTDGCGARFRRRHEIDSRRPVLLNVGRIAYEKNLDVLLDVVAAVRRSIPDVLGVFAGEGPALGHLRRRVAREGLSESVELVGYLQRDGDLQDCYRAADLFIFASRTETQGLVLLEAMALGVPVVSTAVMGTRGVVGPRRGSVVVPESVPEFSAAVVDLLRQPERRRSLSREAEAFAAEWSVDVMADRMLDLYRSLERV